MDPPDTHDEAAAAASQHADGQSAGTKRAHTVQTTVADIYVIGRDIHQYSGHKIGSDMSEDERFRAFFGCGANIALLVWLKLIQYDYLPPDSRLFIYFI